MDAIERVMDQEQTRRMVGAYTFTWFVPRKPRVSVRVHDAASGERVIGVRYRVMSQPHMRPAPARRVSFGGSQVIDDRDPQVRLCTICHRTSASQLQNAPRLCETARAGCTDAFVMQMQRVIPKPPPLASLLEGDGTPEHVHMAFAKGTTPVSGRGPNTMPVPENEPGEDAPQRADSDSDASSPGEAAISYTPSPARKSLLRMQNTREARTALAARKWDEVETWNGDYSDEDSEAWGDMLYEAYSGMDIGITVDVNADITVQVFPVYPFLQRPILQRRPVYDMRGCPTFVLWLPRDLNAHLFWKRRDLLAPFFWNSDGSPGIALCADSAGAYIPTAFAL